MLKTWLLTLTFLLSVVPAIVNAQNTNPDSKSLFSADGYRLDRYRSPTPDTIEGIQTISTPDLKAALGASPTPVVIDVINSEYRASRFIETKPHYSVPGAYWLPNTGRGEMNQQWLDYLASNVRKLTHSKHNYPVIVMCKSDCWLSWNAARRLRAAGFTHLYWYKNGIDSWQNAGLPVEAVTPVPPGF